MYTLDKLATICSYYKTTLEDPYIRNLATEAKK